MTNEVVYYLFGHFSLFTSNFQAKSELAGADSGVRNKSLVNTEDPGWKMCVAPLLSRLRPVLGSTPPDSTHFLIPLTKLLPYEDYRLPRKPCSPCRAPLKPRHISMLRPLPKLRPSKLRPLLSPDHFPKLRLLCSGARNRAAQLGVMQRTTFPSKLALEPVSAQRYGFRIVCSSNTRHDLLRLS